ASALQWTVYGLNQLDYSPKQSASFDYLEVFCEINRKAGTAHGYLSDYPECDISSAGGKLEQPQGVVGGLFCQDGDVDFSLLGQAGSRVNQMDRLIAFTPKWHGRQIGAVRFQEQSIHWNAGSHIPKILGILVRDHAGKGNEQSHRHA